MFNNISSPITSLSTLVKHPIFIIAIIGFAARFLLSPFGLEYDVDYWAVIIRNIESGQGLYGLEGYYYTPIWGYILSFLAMIMELFLRIEMLGFRAFELFSIEVYSEGWTANPTAIGFHLLIKIPLFIVDLIVGYLIYWLIKDRTQDMRKATIGFALWFLCPLVIFISSVSCTFDTISCLFALLCIVMIKKDKLFLAGVIFSFAILTKFFPIYLVFLLLAYILVIHRGDGKAYRSVLKMVLGSIVAFFALMLPQLIHGEFGKSLLFLSSRISAGSSSISLTSILYNQTVLLFAAGVVVAILLGYHLSKESKERLDDTFYKSALLMGVFLLLLPALPQYMLFLMPFLVMCIVTVDRKFILSWIFLSVGGIMIVVGGYYVLLLSSLGGFTGLVSLEWIASAIDWYSTPGMFGLVPSVFIPNTGGSIQYIGVLIAGALLINDWYVCGRRGEKVFWYKFFEKRRSVDQPKNEADEEDR